MALHSINYCERLYYLEEVEGIEVTSGAMYAGRRLHAGLEVVDESGRELRQFNLSSETLGLFGKVDAARKRDGHWIPYEHKRGRCARSDDGEPAAWPSDLVQVTAYAMLLEEHLGEPVSECRIRYHASGVTVRVAVDDRARERVAAGIARARELSASTTRPPVSDNERACLRCSLARVCLPEESRRAVDPHWEPVRLFPPHREGRVVHVVSYGARVSRSGSCLRVAGGDATDDLPIEDIDSLVLHGSAQATTQALHLCFSRGVPVHWFTRGGRYLSGTAIGAGRVQRRIRQYEALRDLAFRVSLARRVAAARVDGQLRYLLRATRGRSGRPTNVRDAIGELREHRKALESEADLDVIRGHEGAATRAYIRCIPGLLKKHVPEELRPNGRSRRPPGDRFNAALSFGYALLQKTVHQAVVGVGLEPALGFYHTPRSAAPPLVLDLMDLFRVALWDIPLIGSINRKQWSVDADFDQLGQGMWLSDSGREKAIAIFERRLDDTWRHSVVDYSLSYERTVELEVRLLEKEWTGEPGLFARSRLR